MTSQIKPPVLSSVPVVVPVSGLSTLRENASSAAVACSSSGSAELCRNFVHDTATKRVFSWSSPIASMLDDFPYYQRERGVESTRQLALREFLLECHHREETKRQKDIEDVKENNRARLEANLADERDKTKHKKIKEEATNNLKTELDELNDRYRREFGHEADVPVVTALTTEEDMVYKQILRNAKKAVSQSFDYLSNTTVGRDGLFFKTMSKETGGDELVDSSRLQTVPYLASNLYGKQLTISRNLSTAFVKRRELSSVTIWAFNRVIETTPTHPLKIITPELKLLDKSNQMAIMLRDCMKYIVGNGNIQNLSDAQLAKYIPVRAVHATRIPLERASEMAEKIKKSFRIDVDSYPFLTSAAEIEWYVMVGLGVANNLLSFVPNKIATNIVSQLIKGSSMSISVNIAQKIADQLFNELGVYDIKTELVNGKYVDNYVNIVDINRVKQIGPNTMQRVISKHFNINTQLKNGLESKCQNLHRNSAKVDLDAIIEDFGLSAALKKDDETSLQIYNSITTLLRRYLEKNVIGSPAAKEARESEAILEHDIITGNYKKKQNIRDAVDTELKKSKLWFDGEYLSNIVQKPPVGGSKFVITEDNVLSPVFIKKDLYTIQFEKTCKCDGPTACEDCSFLQRYSDGLLRFPSVAHMIALFMELETFTNQTLVTILIPDLIKLYERIVRPQNGPYTDPVLINTQVYNRLYKKGMDLYNVKLREIREEKFRTEWATQACGLLANARIGILQVDSDVTKQTLRTRETDILIDFKVNKTNYFDAMSQLPLNEENIQRYSLTAHMIQQKVSEMMNQTSLVFDLDTTENDIQSGMTALKAATVYYAASDGAFEIPNMVNHRVRPKIKSQFKVVEQSLDRNGGDNEKCEIKKWIEYRVAYKRSKGKKDELAAPSISEDLFRTLSSSFYGRANGKSQLFETVIYKNVPLSKNQLESMCLDAEKELTYENEMNMSMRSMHNSSMFTSSLPTESTIAVKVNDDEGHLNIYKAVLKPMTSEAIAKRVEERLIKYAIDESDFEHLDRLSRNLSGNDDDLDQSDKANVDFEMQKMSRKLEAKIMHELVDADYDMDISDSKPNTKKLVENLAIEYCTGVAVQELTNKLREYNVEAAFRKCSASPIIRAAARRMAKTAIDVKSFSEREINTAFEYIAKYTAERDVTSYPMVEETNAENRIVSPVDVERALYAIARREANTTTIWESLLNMVKETSKTEDMSFEVCAEEDVSSAIAYIAKRIAMIAYSVNQYDNLPPPSSFVNLAVIALTPGGHEAALVGTQFSLIPLYRQERKTAPIYRNKSSSNNMERESKSFLRHTWKTLSCSIDTAAQSMAAVLFPYRRMLNVTKILKWSRTPPFASLIANVYDGMFDLHRRESYLMNLDAEISNKINEIDTSIVENVAVKNALLKLWTDLQNLKSSSRDKSFRNKFLDEINFKINHNENILKSQNPNVDLKHHTSELAYWRRLQSAVIDSRNRDVYMKELDAAIYRKVNEIKFNQEERRLQSLNRRSRQATLSTLISEEQKMRGATCPSAQLSNRHENLEYLPHLLKMDNQQEFVEMFSDAFKDVSYVINYFKGMLSTDFGVGYHNYDPEFKNVNRTPNGINLKSVNVGKRMRTENDFNDMALADSIAIYRRDAEDVDISSVSVSETLMELCFRIDAICKPRRIGFATCSEMMNVIARILSYSVEDANKLMDLCDFENLAFPFNNNMVDRANLTLSCDRMSTVFATSNVIDINSNYGSIPKVKVDKETGFVRKIYDKSLPKEIKIFGNFLYVLKRAKRSPMSDISHYYPLDFTAPHAIPIFDATGSPVDVDDPIPARYLFPERNLNIYVSKSDEDRAIYREDEDEVFMFQGVVQG